MLNEIFNQDFSIIEKIQEIIVKNEQSKKEYTNILKNNGINKEDYDYVIRTLNKQNIKLFGLIEQICE